MKAYTMVFLTSEGHSIVTTCEAVNEENAFFGTLKQLTAELKQINGLTCIAFFEGCHKNIWPELEREMVKLSDKHIHMPIPQNSEDAN